MRASNPEGMVLCQPIPERVLVSRGYCCAFLTCEAKGFVRVVVITLTESADQSRFFLGLIRNRSFAWADCIPNHPFVNPLPLRRGVQRNTSARKYSLCDRPVGLVRLN